MRHEGSRNRDFHASRDALAAAVLGALMRPGPPPSERGLAAAGDVSVATLRHYFGDREGAITAAFAFVAAQGARMVLRAERMRRDEPRASLRYFLRHLLRGWREILGSLHAAALREALASPALGPAYLTTLLEPTLQAAEARLAWHAERGELEVPNPRAAALLLCAPLILAGLHQDALGGRDLRPLDLDALATEQADLVYRALRPTKRR